MNKHPDSASHFANQITPSGIINGLFQARYALKDFNTKQPGCGFDKLALTCEAAADALTSVVSENPASNFVVIDLLVKKIAMQRGPAESDARAVIDWLKKSVNTAKAICNLREFCENLIHFFGEEDWAEDVTIMVNQYGDGTEEVAVTACNLTNDWRKSPVLPEGFNPMSKISLADEILCCAGGSRRVDVSSFTVLSEFGFDKSADSITIKRGAVEPYLLNTERDPLDLLGDLRPGVYGQVMQQLYRVHTNQDAKPASEKP